MEDVTQSTASKPTTQTPMQPESSIQHSLKPTSPSVSPSFTNGNVQASTLQQQTTVLTAETGTKKRELEPAVTVSVCMTNTL